MAHAAWCCHPRELDGSVFRTRMEIVADWLWICCHHFSHVKLQTIQHSTRISICFTILKHSGIGNHHRLTFRYIEGDKRRSCLNSTLCRRSKLLSSSHNSTVDADVYQRLHLILVRIVMVGLQCVLAGCHACYGQYERCTLIFYFRQVTINNVRCQHFVTDHPQASSLHISLTPIAAYILCGTSCTYLDGHAIVECLRIALCARHGPRNVVDFRILARSGLAGEVKIDILRSCIHYC